jgi:hypothetical protein
MSPKAMVKEISATGFTEAIDLMACLAVLREGNSLVVPRALEAANAALAATIVQKALLQRVLMTVERAFAPVKYNSDRHARVAFKHLSDPNIFDEVAKAGSRKHLQQACIPGADTMQTPDAKNSSTIAIKSWHIRPCENYRRPSSLNSVATLWAQPMCLRD